MLVRLSLGITDPEEVGICLLKYFLANAILLFKV